MSFGQRRGLSSDDAPPPRTRTGSLSARASGVPSVVGISKRVGGTATDNSTDDGVSCLRQGTAVGGGVGARGEHDVKRVATTAALGKENVTRGGRPSSARPATRVSVERAPPQVRHALDFSYFPPHPRPLPPTPGY